MLLCLTFVTTLTCTQFFWKDALEASSEKLGLEMPRNKENILEAEAIKGPGGNKTFYMMSDKTANKVADNSHG